MRTVTHNGGDGGAARTLADVESPGRHAVAPAPTHGAEAGPWGTVARLAEAAWLLPGLILLGLLLRLAVLRLDHVLMPDGVDYVLLARQMSEGSFRSAVNAWTPPLYPLLVALASALVGDGELAGRLVSVVAGSLLVVPVYFLTRRAHGRRVAGWAAALAALHPLLVYYSTQVLTEATYTLCFVCAVLAGWQALSTKRPRTFAVAGLAFGACYLLRAEAVGFLLLLLALTLAAGLAGKTASKKTVLANCLALAAGSLALAAPYLIHLRVEYGAWTVSAKLYGHLWQGDRGFSIAAAVPAGYPLLPGVSVMFAQLAKALRSEYELLNLVFPPTFVALAALGLFGTAWTRRRALYELYLLLFIAAALVGYAVTLPNIRFLVPLLPLTFGWVAAGALRVERWLRKTVPVVLGGRGARLGRLPFVPFAVALLVLSLTPLFVYLMRGDKWDDYDGQRRVALWIKERGGGARPPRVMSTVPVPAFYAGGESIWLEDEGYDAFIERARRERADFVVVNQRDFKNMRLRSLLDEGAAHPGLRLVHRLSDVPGHEMLVYVLTD